MDRRRRAVTVKNAMTDRRRADEAHVSAVHEASGTRTTAAGRDLLNAIHADLLDLFRRAKQRRTRSRAAYDQQTPIGRPSRARNVFWRALLGFGVISGLAIIAILGLIGWSLHNLPLEQPDIARSEPAIAIEAADGSPLGRVGTFKTADAELDDFPKHLIDAVLSIEDRRFYSHSGVDARGIMRALRSNMRAGAIVEGGSTITQQLVRMMYLGNERTYTRKLQEAIAAFWLEGQLSKDEILTRYLNTVYLGANTRGMPAAARVYFDKDVSELTLAEAAMLAGLIRAPSVLNPLRAPEAARQRAGVVLDSMVATKLVSKADADQARAEPARVNHPAGSKVGSWFADWAAEEASRLAGSFTGNLKVRTTLVPELQRLAETTVAEFLAEGAGHGISQAALVAMRPDGAVVAMVGGRDYGESQFNRATQALRQPGSAFKLFVYLAALREGYRSGDVIDAGPIELDDWKPENFGGAQYGSMTLADAFAKSVNTASVRLALDVGLDRIVAAARDLGIDAPLPEHPSLALGAAEVSLIDLTGAYASLRFGSTPVEPYGIAAFGDENQSRLYSVAPSADARKPLGPERAELIGLLQQVVERGTGRQAALDGFAAGKTGTSEKHRDAWFIGFTEDLVAGVWVGNDDGAPMDEVTGGSLPALMWQRFMTGAKPLVGAHGPLVASIDGSSDRSWAFDRPVGVPGPASCNIRACSAKYRSFRPDDCTYQPFSGARRICDIGQERAADMLLAEPLAVQPDASSQDLAEAIDTPEEEPLPPPPDMFIEPAAPAKELAVEPSLAGGRSIEPAPDDIATIEDADAPISGVCDLAACAAKYNSFDSSDCTFQPFGGGSRQLCEIGPGALAGEPSNEVRELPPDAAPTSAEVRFSGTARRIFGLVPETGEPIVMVEEGSAEVAPPSACNIMACAARYSSFRAADCTYQPLDGGPRRYCER